MVWVYLPCLCYVMEQLAPNPGLKKITILLSNLSLLQVPFGWGKDKKDLRTFAVLNEPVEGPTHYFLLLPEETGGFCEEDLQMCHRYRVCVIKPYDGDNENGMTATVILAYIAPRFLVKDIPVAMMQDQDFDYLLLPEEKAEAALAILHDLFTVEPCEGLLP